MSPRTHPDLPSSPLGYQDSNLEWMNQNHLCCQLHHTPLVGAPPERNRPEQRKVIYTAAPPAHKSRTRECGHRLLRRAGRAPPGAP